MDSPRNLSRENQLANPLEILRGGNGYKIDYSAVTLKSRCLAELVNIACNIDTLQWSGRRDSKSRS